MIIGIYPNPNRDKDLVATHKLLSLCTDNNIKCYVDDKVDISIDAPRCDVSLECDIIISLGGDGTILHYIRQAQSYKAPILGINLGNMGYLTEGGYNDIETMFKCLIEGRYRVDTRQMLSVETDGYIYNSLNEAVIAIGDRFKLLNINLFIDDLLVDNYMADGLIISTPTGSTAYALAAGGPIVSPDIDAFIVAAICPHSLNIRPMVISDRHTLKLKLNSNDAARLVVDGLEVKSIQPDGIATITRSDKCVKLINISNMNFYSKVKNKLNQ